MQAVQTVLQDCCNKATHTTNMSALRADALTNQKAHVGSEKLLAVHYLREVYRETVRVPHLKGILAINVLPIVGLGSGCSLLQTGNALIQCLAKAYFFLTAGNKQAC